MNTIVRNMTRRSFLMLPALVPLTTVGRRKDCEEHYFCYESVIGTSLDLVIWTASAHVAELACQTVLQEIDRLASILNVRDPESEISLLENSTLSKSLSQELKEVFAAYNYWEHRTDGIFSMRPNGPRASRNVDALGKAYIIDYVAEAVRKSWPSVDALLLNVGGDIVVWGRDCEIAVADPGAWYDNAEPIAKINLRDAAVATSATYARAAHLMDARTGQLLRTAAAATVVAPDTITANALATTLCLAEADYGLRLVEQTPGAEAISLASGAQRRSSGFALFERPFAAQTPVSSNWPPGYQLTVTLPLTSGRSKKRPYVAVWVEDSAGKLVRILALWGNNLKYQPDLSTIWSLASAGKSELRSVSRATRPAGKYELVWDGLDNERKPVPLGTYRIVVETNQEHGTYAKQAGTITLGDAPASITLPATTNFDNAVVQYGPK